MTTQELTLDSREVAEMIGREHKELLRTIKNYVEILEEEDSAKLRAPEFFIPSTYLTAQNKEQPCFLLKKLLPEGLRKIN